MSKCKLSIIGLGNMGKTILNGIESSNLIKPYLIGLYTLEEDILNNYSKKGYTIFKDEKDLCDNSEIVLLAIKPQGIEELVNKIKDSNIKCLVSILAGVSIDYYHKNFNCPIIRIMPNMPLQINKGASAISHDDKVDKKDLDLIIDIFKSMGVVNIIDESLMNDILVVNGSTPAYVYYFINAMINDAVKRGIDEEVAKEMIIQTFIGSSLMLKNSNKTIQEQIDAVCSKGGTTIEAINTFKEKNLDEIIHLANTNCINRAKVIGK
ncbi:MAG: pyrroline-5-carboxylate reductase [Bacillota bacterium]|jgi:pyrroline-5-carboxylate reductase|nr:pyrroline-5-carboxylate reductase [Bacillota bacterium]